MLCVFVCVLRILYLDEHLNPLKRPCHT